MKVMCIKNDSMLWGTTRTGLQVSGPIWGQEMNILACSSAENGMMLYSFSEYGAKYYYECQYFVFIETNICETIIANERRNNPPS